MGQPNQEPSMEDILASIKRIIAEDTDLAGARTPKPRKGPVAVPDAATPPEPEIGSADPEPESAVIPEPAAQPEPPAMSEPFEPSDVLELTSPLVEPYEEPVMAAAEPSPAAATPDKPALSILSSSAETASRNAFAALSQLQVRVEGGQDNTLEGLVSDMLRPMLRDWLDRELPGIVERLVEAEVKRVSGRG